jgi:AraC-like DNA-binding protein
MNFSKYRQVILLSSGSGIMLLLVYFSIFFRKDFFIFPSDTSKVEFFSDSADNGNSEILSVSKSESVASFRFQLHKGFISPYSGIGFRSRKGDFFDLSEYNRMEVTTLGENIKQLRVLFQVADKNISNKKHRLADRFLEGDLYLDKPSSKTVRTLNFREFLTAQWWLDLIDQDLNEFGDPEWEHVKYISFNNGLNTPIEENCSFSIYEVRFYRDNSLVIVLMVIGQLVLTTAFFWFFHKRNKIKPVTPNELVIRYTPAVTREDFSELPSYLKYIHENYSKGDLSLSDVAENSQLSERKISELIAEKFNCNFKTYINLIRVAEARRLMEQTELNISEIAYKVGYNSPASFNRVFKSTTGMSPTEYLQSIGK